MSSSFRVSNPDGLAPTRRSRTPLAQSNLVGVDDVVANTNIPLAPDYRKRLIRILSIILRDMRSNYTNNPLLSQGIISHTMAHTS